MGYDQSMVVLWKSCSCY